MARHQAKKARFKNIGYLEKNMKNAGFFKQRETKFVSTNLDKVHLDGSFSGFASIFGDKDLGNDVVEKGAFANSLSKRSTSMIKMLFQHDPDQPIGVWTHIEETSKGLFVQGQITQGVSKGAEVLELMRSGAVDGLSIGFRTVRAKQDRIKNVRRILEADLWEISVVTFPMQEGARIEAVKANQIGRKKPTVREFERWLLRDAGLTRSEAKAVIAHGYSHVSNTQAAVSDTQTLAERIRDAASKMSPTY